MYETYSPNYYRKAGKRRTPAAGEYFVKATPDNTDAPEGVTIAGMHLEATPKTASEAFTEWMRNMGMEL